MADTTPAPRHPRHEAREVVGSGLDPRVLEPSPPAVTEGPWYADDPVAPVPAEVSAAGTAPVPLLVPAGRPGDHQSWDQWLAQHPDRAAWAAERWLAGPRRLPPIPEPGTLAATRRDLHRLAAYVIAPTRHAATGKFGLRWSLGGFGTPYFGDDRQIRVTGTTLIDQRAGEVRSTPITTLQAAADFLATAVDPATAAEHDSPPPGDPGSPLAVDETASRFLGAWFGMAFAALETVRADPASVDPSRPQLWPGHFDPSIELGDDDHRGSYGASPGDDAHPDPYLYVSVWWPDRLGLAGGSADPFWNASGFTGRILPLDQLPPADDPVPAAVRFWTESRDALAKL